MSPEELNPIKPNFRGESTRLGKVRPDDPPQTKKEFSRLINNDDEREPDEELVVEDKEMDSVPPSPFDLLAKKTKKLPDAPSPAFEALPPKAKEVVAEKNPVFFVSEENEDKLAAFFSEGPEAPVVSTLDTGKPLPAKPWFEGEKPAFYTLEETPEQPQQPVIKEAVAQPKVKEAQELAPEFAVENTKGRRDAFTLETDAPLIPASKKEKIKLNTTRESAFTVETNDISSLNPQAFQPAPLPSDPSLIADEPQQIRTAVNDIVEQMVKSLQTIEKGGRVDTVVTLQYPPLFADATITLTALDGKRDFNLSFANLKEEAKVFLDRRIMEDSLVETLARNDITIHQLKTSTLPETHINVDIEQQAFAREEREQQRGRERQNPYEDET
ncbi:MAG: hypothetical protein LW832_04760 [Parachlamydia sp.]|jgi:hypothetical protein|nr:hypothetical protein [Parachlamydia sp.]